MRETKSIVAVLLVALTCAVAASADPTPESTPLIHCTDLYHPHNDPDDHWDLATVFALAKSGRLNLLGVCLDAPLAGEGRDSIGDPGIIPIAQLNHITGLAVPAVVGSSKAYEAGVAASGRLPASDLAAANFLIDTLRRSARKVCISIVGSCRDVAIASELAPEVFRDKCQGIYLNAGTGTTDPAKGANTEWNVLLNPASYRRMFEIPCPVYWLPCFEQMVFADGGGLRVGTYGSFWAFKQGDILPHLSARAQNFFLHALSRAEDNRWLQYLYKEPDQAKLNEQGQQVRNMWCTAGFLHMSGLTATRAGEIVRLSSAAETAYTFEPIAVELNNEGVGNWSKLPGSNRFIIEIQDTATYPEAMQKALGSLLADL